MTRLLSIVLAAAAVLAVIGGIWWATARDDGGPAQGVPAAGGSAEPGFDPSPADPLPVAPDPGEEPGLPVKPGPDEPGTPAGPVRPVPVTGYGVTPGGGLKVSYTIGVPACYGRITEPRVEETPSAVTVTLTRREPKPDPAVSCIDIALVKQVRVTLDTPLGDRVVRDGSTGAVVPEGGMPGFAGEPGGR